MKNIGLYVFFVAVGFVRIGLDWDEPDLGVEGLVGIGEVDCCRSGVIAIHRYDGIDEERVMEGELSGRRLYLGVVQPQSFLCFL